MPLPSLILRLLERRLSPRLFDSLAGDLEEQWQRDRHRTPARAWYRLVRTTAAVLWHARLDSRRHAPTGAVRRRGWMMTELVQDLRFAWRLGIRQPWLSLAAVVTLALGIGATTAMFSVLNAWLLTPLPYHRPDRIAAVWETIPSASIFENTPAPASLREWKARASTIARFAPWTLGTVNLTGAGEPAQLTAAIVSPDLLPLLGVSPILGRNFTAEEAQPNGAAATLLTHDLWTSRFGARADILGQRLLLSGAPVTVVGVLPPDVRLLDLDVDLWQPLAMSAAVEASENRMLWVFARLRDEATFDRAGAELDAIQRGRQEGTGARAVPLQQQSVGEMGRDVVVLFGATGLVMLIACANVASLSLARITGRRQELLVRTALGAGRTRLVRQVLTESVALAVIGGTLGLLLAAWAIRALVSLLPRAERLPVVDVATPAVFLFATAAVLAASVLFGLAPAWQSSKTPLAGALRASSHSLFGGRRRTLRSIVIGEIAMALALLIGASLVARSYQRLSSIDLGFKPEGAVAFQIPRPDNQAHDASVRFFGDLLSRLHASPGIEAAGLIQALPLRSSAMGAGFRIEGRSGDGASILSYWRVISPNYFAALGVPLLRGRAIAESDKAGTPRVAVVSESFARRAWPDREALGKRIGWGTLERPLTVVGVVADVRLSPAAPHGPHVYMAFPQVPDRLPHELVVRSTLATAAAVDVVRRAVWQLDARQPVAGISTLEGLASRSLARRRLHLTLFGGFAGVAVLLAFVGIYGVLSYMVSQMSSELGLRLALGATAPRLAWTVLKNGLATASAGVVVGTALAFWSAELLRGFVFQVDARDPLTYAVVALTVLGGATAACLLPAIRAARVDPLSTLRS